jgi:CheY-like chemotaxis protein
MARVLIVDDSELILQMLAMVIAQAGHEVLTAETWDEAVVHYGGCPDVVVTDLNLPDQADPVAAFHAMGPTPVIIVSGRPQAELDELASACGAAGAVSKDAGMMGMAAVLPDLIGRVVA